MEEDNIAVSLCILIIIASAILRIRLDRRPPRVHVWTLSWIRRRARYCAHHSLITELSSEDPELSSEEPTGNRQPYFSLFFC